MVLGEVLILFIYFNECSSNPCLNGATCHDGIGKYVCICSEGFINVNCEIDIQEPVITNLPADIIENTTVGEAYAIVGWVQPQAYDNSDIQTLTSNHQPGDQFPIGLTVVEYTSFDSAGNSATGSFLVTVKDNERPVFNNIPVNIKTNTDRGLPTSEVVWNPPLASDNSNSNVILTSNYNIGDSFLIGNTTVTYTAVDQFGNTATTQFEIIVIDTEKPIINDIPNNITQSANIGEVTAVVTWVPPSATDNSGQHYLTCDHTPGKLFIIGDTVVTYTATDEAGNTATAGFIISVKDTEAPTIIGIPDDIYRNITGGQWTVVVTWSEPNATDNQGPVTMTSSHNPGDVFLVGETLVNYTVYDEAGNTATDSFLVFITDDESPIISNVPNDIYQPKLSKTDSVLSPTWIPPVATDNSGMQTLTSSHDPGDVFPNGITTVTYTSIDLAGNMDSVSFIVEVLYMRPLGMEDMSILLSQITVSSTHGPTFPKGNSRYNSPTCWIPNSNDPNPAWIQIDLIDKYNVSGIVTQGTRYGGYQWWVASLYIQYDVPGTGLVYIRDEQGNNTLFPANVNRIEDAVIILDHTIETSILRLWIVDYVGTKSLRFEIFYLEHLKPPL